jgi:hypothetical protein
MAIIDIDMEGVQEGGSFKVLDPGVYGAQITACELSAQPGPSGYKYFEFTFLLKDMNGRRLWKNYSISPGALWGLKTDLIRLGIEVPDGPFQFDTEEVIGKTCKLKVGQKPHYQGGVDSEGKPRMDNEIEEVLADDGEFAWTT